MNLTNNTLWVKKNLDHFSFEHNCRKNCAILIIFHHCRQKLSAHKHVIEFSTLPIVCCCTTLKNQQHTLFTKTVEWICNAYGNFIVVTKLEILVLSLPEFFDAASRRHNDVILLPATCRVFGNDFVPAGQCTGIPRCAVQQSNCCVKKRQTFLNPTCGLQTAQISVLWMMRSGLSYSIVFTTDKFIVWISDENKVIRIAKCDVFSGVCESTW